MPVGITCKVTISHTKIRVEHKTAEEMADILNFDARHPELLTQLLNEEYDSLLSSVLYAIDAGDGNLGSII